MFEGHTRRISFWCHRSIAFLLLTSVIYMSYCDDSRLYIHQCRMGSNYVLYHASCEVYRWSCRVSAYCHLYYGVHGIASVLVMIHHSKSSEPKSIVGFSTRSYWDEPAEENRRLIQLPPFRLLFNGPSM